MYQHFKDCKEGMENQEQIIKDELAKATETNEKYMKAKN